MNVTILASSVSDNYFYLVSDDAGRAALIDPVDARVAIEAVNAADLELDYVFNTHFHHDHIAGDDAVLDAFPHANLLAGADADQITVKHPIAKVLAHGDEINIGGVHCRILDTPGHTAGHVSLLIEGHLFSGDTIFVGGAGNCRFGGDPGVLFATYRDVLSTLPDDTRFYPGHDYAKQNIAFALSIEPDHPKLLAMRERTASHTEGIFLTTLGEERRYNPFFRWNDPALLDALKQAHGDVWREQRDVSRSDEEGVFRTIRELRNHW